MTYLQVLEGELTAAGIPADRRRRILDEFADHLHENPSAELGAPAELARRFADELGTRLARGAALRAFAALALTGIVMAVMFLADGSNRQFSFSATNRTPTPGWAAPLLMLSVLAAQVALAAGGLALLRALRMRNRPLISWDDATVLVRRAAVALLAGAVALAGVPVIAVAFPNGGGSIWHVLAWVLTAIALVGLALAAPAVLRAVRLRPRVPGRATDLVDDLDGLVPRGFTATRIALLVCAAIVVLVALAGAAADDPYDGLARGLADAVACMTGYLVLGRYLGLRAAGARSRTHG
jgi:hypothetical protein